MGEDAAATPPFDAAAFSAAARTAILGLARARVALDAAIARRFTTDAMWERLRAQIETYRLNGWHAVVENLTVGDAEDMERSARGDGVEQVRTLVRSSGRVYDADARGAVVAGSPELSEWTDTWTFERAPAAARLTACPMCGAPLSLDDRGACTYCHAAVPGARDEWLAADVQRVDLQDGLRPGDLEAREAARRVVEAAAALDGVPAADAAVPAAVTGADAQAALAALRTRDPELDERDLLAQARQAFLAIEAAWTSLQPQRSRAVVSDALWEAQRAAVQSAAAAGVHNVRPYLDVDAAEIIGAEAGDVRERVTVRIHARSADYDVELRSGRVVRGDDTVSTWHEDLTLERAAGVRTVPGADPLEDCGACGVSAAGVDQHGCCRACGAHVTGGEHGWVVTAVERLPGL